MWCVWIGAVLVGAKLVGLGPVASWPWWWVLAPLALAFAWFEGLERLLGRDRRKLAHDALQQRQRQRAREALATAGRRRGRRRAG